MINIYNGFNKVCNKFNTINIIGIIFNTSDPLTDYTKMVPMIDNKLLPHNNIINNETLLIYNENLNQFNNKEYKGNGSGNAQIREYRSDSNNPKDCNIHLLGIPVSNNEVLDESMRIGIVSAVSYIIEYIRKHNIKNIIICADNNNTTMTFGYSTFTPHDTVKDKIKNEIKRVIDTFNCNEYFYNHRLFKNTNEKFISKEDLEKLILLNKTNIEPWLYNRAQHTNLLVIAACMRNLDLNYNNSDYSRWSNVDNNYFAICQEDKYLQLLDPNIDIDNKDYMNKLYKVINKKFKVIIYDRFTSGHFDTTKIANYTDFLATDGHLYVQLSFRDIVRDSIGIKPYDKDLNIILMLQFAGPYMENHYMHKTSITIYNTFIENLQKNNMKIVEIVNLNIPNIDYGLYSNSGDYKGIGTIYLKIGLSNDNLDHTIESKKVIDDFYATIANETYHNLVEKYKQNRTDIKTLL